MNCTQNAAAATGVKCRGGDVSTPYSMIYLYMAIVLNMSLIRWQQCSKHVQSLA